MIPRVTTKTLTKTNKKVDKLKWNAKNECYEKMTKKGNDGTKQKRQTANMTQQQT